MRRALTEHNRRCPFRFGVDCSVFLLPICTFWSHSGQLIVHRREFGDLPFSRGSGDYNRQPTFPADVSCIIATTQACRIVLPWDGSPSRLSTVLPGWPFWLPSSSLLLFLSIDENPR